MPNLARLQPMKIQTNDGTVYDLSGMTLRSYEFLMQMDPTVDPRECSVQLIHEQLVSPELSLEEVRALPDATLRKILRAYAKDRLGLNRALPTGGNTFANFRAAVVEYQRDLKAMMDKSAKEILKVTAAQMRDMERAIKLIPSSISLAGLDTAIARSSLDSTLNSIRKLSEGIELSQLVNPMGMELKAVFDSIKWAEESAGLMEGLIRDSSQTGVFSESLQSLIGNAFQASNFASGLYSSNVAGWLSNSLPSLPTSMFRDNLVMPPIAESVLLGTVRHVSLPQTQRVADPTLSRIVDDANSDMVSIEVYLERVNPRFVTIWRGCWITLRSDSPDRIRQSAHSGRELLNQLLDYLAPDALFTEQELKLHNIKGNKASRKMKAAKIMNTKTDSSKVELVDSVANAFTKLYDSLSARAHDRSDAVSETEVRGYLTTLQALILILLGDRQI